MMNKGKRCLSFGLRSLLAFTFLCAVGIVVFQRFYVPPLSRISGLELIGQPSNKDWQTVRLERDATRRTVQDLIANIKEGSSLWFFDKSYPNPYVPGAYITVSRHHGELLCEFGGHARLTEPFPVTQAEIVEYLWVCRADNQPGAIRPEYDDDGIMTFDTTASAPRKQIERDPKYSYRLHMESRIASAK